MNKQTEDKFSWRDLVENWGKDEIKIELEVEGFGWAGFWIGLGIVIAAGVMKGQIILQ